MGGNFFESFLLKWIFSWQGETDLGVFQKSHPVVTRFNLLSPGKWEATEPRASTEEPEAGAGGRLASVSPLMPRLSLESLSPSGVKLVTLPPI